MRDLDLLALILQTPGALPPIVYGPPGIGKSSRLYQLTSALKRNLETVISSIRDPSDFAGLPVPDNGHGVRMEPPAWAVRIRDKAQEGIDSILFLDEASCAAPAVQAALLRVVLERWVGDLQLPDSTRIVLAANPPEQAAGGWDLAPPMANRLVHLRWESPHAADWSDWLMGHDRDRPIPTLDLEEWQAQFLRAKAQVSAYLHRRPGHLAEDLSKITGRFPLAFASPRTWECATRLLATFRAMGHYGETLQVMTATLGEPIALEFTGWLRNNDLPDPEALLANPDSWKPDDQYPDRAFAVCLSVVEAAISTNGDKDSAAAKKKRDDRWHAAWNVLEKAMTIGKDIVTIAGRRLADPKYRPEKSCISAKAQKVLVQLREVDQASRGN